MSELAGHYMEKRKLYNSFLQAKNIITNFIFEFLRFIPFLFIMIVILYFVYIAFNSFGWYSSISEYFKSLSIPMLTLFLTSFLLVSVRNTQTYLQNLKMRRTMFYMLMIKLREFLFHTTELFDLPSSYDIIFGRNIYGDKSFVIEKEDEKLILQQWRDFDIENWDHAPKHSDFNNNIQFFNYALQELSNETDNICHYCSSILEKKSLNILIQYVESMKSDFQPAGHINWKEYNSSFNPIVFNIENALNIMYLLYKPWLIGCKKLDYWFLKFDIDGFIH